MFDYDFFDDPVYHITKDSAEFKNLCKKYDRMTTGIIGYRTNAEIFIKDEKRTYIRIKYWLDEHYEKKKCF